MFEKNKVAGCLRAIHNSIKRGGRNRSDRRNIVATMGIEKEGFVYCGRNPDGNGYLWVKSQLAEKPVSGSGEYFYDLGGHQTPHLFAMGEAIEFARNQGGYDYDVVTLPSENQLKQIAQVKRKLREEFIKNGFNTSNLLSMPVWLRSIVEFNSTARKGVCASEIKGFEAGKNRATLATSNARGKKLPIVLVKVTPEMSF